MQDDFCYHLERYACAARGLPMPKTEHRAVSFLKSFFGFWFTGVKLFGLLLSLYAFCGLLCRMMEWISS